MVDNILKRVDWIQLGRVHCKKKRTKQVGGPLQPTFHREREHDDVEYNKTIQAFSAYLRGRVQLSYKLSFQNLVKIIFPCIRVHE